MTGAPNKNTNLFSGISSVLQTIIAAGIVWMATEVNKIDAAVAAMQERTKALETIRPAVDQLHLSQEEIKERLIRVEDNQRKNFNTKNN